MTEVTLPRSIIDDAELRRVLESRDAQYEAELLRLFDAYAANRHRIDELTDWRRAMYPLLAITRARPAAAAKGPS